MSLFSLLLMFVALGGMMFFMNRSQRKQQNERQALLDSMKVGDKIVTIGGLHGVISEINNEERTIFIDCEGIILEFDRAAIKTAKPATIVSNDSDVTTVETHEEIAAESEVEVETTTTTAAETSEENETKE